MCSSFLEESVFTQTKVLVLTAKKDEIKATVIETRYGQRLFSVYQTFQSINSAEGSLNLSKDSLLTAFKSLLQQIKTSIQDQIQEIDMIICTIDPKAKYNLYPFLTGSDHSVFDLVLPSISLKKSINFPTISDWMTSQFNFRNDCRISNPIPDLIASYLSFSVGPDDIVLHLSFSDEILIPIRSDQWNDGNTQIVSNPFYALNGHTSKNNEHYPFLAQIRCQGFGKARDTIREEYTKTWKAFKQLVQVVSPGGTAGLDDKIFLFFLFDDQDELQSIRRYEYGTCVSEFNDLRANPRSSLEGQALYARKILSELKQKESQTTADKSRGYWGAANCLPFKPFDRMSVPNKCWIISNESSTIETECIAEVMGQVIGAPCVVLGDNEETTTSQSCIGAVYLCLFQQYLERGQTEMSYDEFIRSFQHQHQQRPNAPTGNTTPTSSPSPRPQPVEEEQQRTPRASRRRPSLIPSPHVHFSLDRGSSGDSTPTLRNRTNRAISSVSALLSKEEESLQDLDATPKLRQRQRSVSLSASTVNSSPPSSTFGQVLSPPTSLHSELTNEGEEDANLIKTQFSSINSSDEDLWLFYGTMLEEYVRLWDTIQRSRTTPTISSPK